MYCKHCGMLVDGNSKFCSNCGMRLDNKQEINNSEDSPSFGFAVLGFFVPLVGLILFLVYEGKRPQRAKSAGKGALFGFITGIILSVVCVILCMTFANSFIGNYMNIFDSSVQSISDTINDINEEITNDNFGYDDEIDSDIFNNESTDEILEKYVDVTFGEFKISDNGYFSETYLEVTVKNNAEKQYSYYITIEAVDENGTRIETDTVFVEKLNSGQDINLTAFEYVNEEKIEQLKNATFKVLDVEKYSF